MTPGGLTTLKLPPLGADPDRPVGIRLMSDLHLGAATTDADRIRMELEDAGDHGDRVLLGGDVFDLILPNDRRRYNPSAVHPSLRGRDDLVNAAVEMAVDLLEDYAGLIDGIGQGNHETAAVRSASVDAVRLLCQRLGADREVPIAQLGYTALIRYPLTSVSQGTPLGTYSIHYHHGSGRVGTAAGGLKALLARIGLFPADLFWCGHHHLKASCVETTYRMVKGRLVPREVRCVVTGSYSDPYREQPAAVTARGGPRNNYASEAGLTPHGCGGARVLLTPEPSLRQIEVQVIH